METRRTFGARPLALAAWLVGAVACGPQHAVFTVGDGGIQGSAAGRPCKADADCGPDPVLVCGVNQSGQPVCVSACNAPYGNSVHGIVPGSDACFNGRVTPCEQLPSSSTCGCGCGDGTYCLVAADGKSGQCVPKLAPGSPCQEDAICASRICFACLSPGNCWHSPNGICSVPIGAPCTGPADCPLCTNGWCSIGCSGLATTMCPYGSACLGASGNTEGICYEQCGGSGGSGGLPGTTGCPTGTSCKAYAGSATAFSGYACY